MNMEVVQRVRAEVAQRLSEGARSAPTSNGSAAPGNEMQERELSQALITAALGRYAHECVERGERPLSPSEEDGVARDVTDSLFGLGRFQRYIDDRQITNIDANGCDDVWLEYADGHRERGEPVAASDEELVQLLQQAARQFGLNERRFDQAVPRLALQLPDGSRLFAVMAVTRRPAVSIRRHRYLSLTLEELRRLGAVDQLLRDFLDAAVRARLSIVISGAPNTGKTTMLRGLASSIPARERIITIEKSFELGLDEDAERHPDVVAMEAREANIEGQGEITQRELLRWSLVMRPNRIIVGEVLGDEVIPMLNAMSVGLPGSMCTVHANSTKGAFDRFQGCAIQSPERLEPEHTNLLIANAVDLVIHLTMDVQGRRFVSSVREVTGADGRVVVTNEVFAAGPDGIARPLDPLRTETVGRLAAVGFDPDEMDPRRWLA